ncbi:hypothetical protein ACP0HM_11425 [Escherichia coli]
MTIAERLRQEGHQIGWQEGKLEGLHEQAIKNCFAHAGTGL